jgi:hypothetical protein
MIRLLAAAFACATTGSPALAAEGGVVHVTVLGGTADGPALAAQRSGVGRELVAACPWRAVVAAAWAVDDVTTEAAGIGHGHLLLAGGAADGAGLGWVDATGRVASPVVVAGVRRGVALAAQRLGASQARRRPDPALRHRLLHASNIGQALALVNDKATRPEDSCKSFGGKA